MLISDAVTAVQGHVHSREIGLIEVKSFSEPVKVYEPYEIVLDLPAALDPLKNPEASGTAGGKQSPAADGGNGGTGHHGRRP